MLRLQSVRSLHPQPARQSKHRDYDTHRSGRFRRGRAAKPCGEISKPRETIAGLTGGRGLGGADGIAERGEAMAP